jgi:hypothetical protein
MLLAIITTTMTHILVYGQIRFNDIIEPILMATLILTRIAMVVEKTSSHN